MSPLLCPVDTGGGKAGYTAARWTAPIQVLSKPGVNGLRRGIHVNPAKVRGCRQTEKEV